MKRFVQLISVISIVFFSFCDADAQKRGGKQNQYWEAGVFAGLSVYQGDIASSSFPVSEGSFAIGFSARNYITPILAFRGNLYFTRLSDEEMEGEMNGFRGLKFNTSILEISGVLEYEPLGEKRSLKGGKKSFFVSPYVYGGFGAAFTNPQAAFPTGFSIGDLGPVEQDIKNGESNMRVALLTGLGIKFDFGRKWILQGDLGPRLPFTDYLDGISETANPDKGDLYWIGGITALFNMR